MVTWSPKSCDSYFYHHPRNESYSKMMHMQKIQFTYFRKIDFIFVKNARNLREGQIQRSRSNDLTWPWNKPKSCFQCFWLIKTAGTDSEKKRFLLCIASSNATHFAKGDSDQFYFRWLIIKGFDAEFLTSIILFFYHLNWNLSKARWSAF